MTEHSFSQNRRHKTKHNSCNVLLGKEETQAQASHQVVFTDGHKIFAHDLKDTPLVSLIMVIRWPAGLLYPMLMVITYLYSILKAAEWTDTFC